MPFGQYVNHSYLEGYNLGLLKTVAAKADSLQHEPPRETPDWGFLMCEFRREHCETPTRGLEEPQYCFPVKKKKKNRINRQHVVTYK